MDGTTASVIVCVYNRGKEVQRCLDSLLALDDQSFEIVLVDDASTDDTARHLNAFRQNHPGRRIQIVRNERNLGVSGARNVGLAAAMGDFVLFTDSDCTVDHVWLGKMVSSLDAPGVAATAGVVLNEPPANFAERAYVGRTRIKQSSWQSRSLVGGNMGFRRDIAMQYMFDDALTYGCDEDDLAWRMQSDGHLVTFTAEAIVHHHHPLNLRRYLHMGFRQGIGSARYWYKRGVYLGRDLAAGFAACFSLPLVTIDARWVAVPVVFAAVQLAAMAFNEIALKEKSLLETILVFPICVLYQLCKAAGVLATWLRLAVGREPNIRSSKRKWLNRRCHEAK